MGFLRRHTAYSHRSSRVVCTGLLIAALWTLAGCGSTSLDRPLRFRQDDWRQEGFDGGRSRFDANEILNAPLDTLWLEDAGGPVHAASPLAGDGVFIVPLRSGGIEVFDAASGEDIGYFDISGFVMGSPAVLDGRLYVPVTGEKSALQCLDMESGELLWSRPTASIETAVAVRSQEAAGRGETTMGRGETTMGRGETTMGRGGRIVVTSYDGHVYCFTPADSVELWDITPGGNIYASPAIADSVVVAVTADGDVFAFDLGSGDLCWRVPVFAPVFASPVIVADRVYVLSQAGVLRCLRTSDGGAVWSRDFEVPAYASPVCDGEQLYVALSDGSVIALDVRGGNETWRYRLNGIVSAAPLVTANTVFAASLEGQLALLDKRSGELLWSEKVQGRIYTAPTMYRGSVLIANEWGDLFVYRTAAQREEAK